MDKAEAYKELKNRRGLLRELAVYQRFQLQGFDWENLDYFGVLDLCSLMGGISYEMRLHIGVRLY